MVAAHWLIAGYLPSAILLAGWGLAARRQGASLPGTTLVIASFVVGLSLGMTLLPDVLGGVLGGLVLALIAQAVLGGPLIPYRTLAWGLPATIAVGRVGCYLSGCCFGTPTGAPWGVVHEAGTIAHGLHASLGWVAHDAATSLPVHPYPLYQAGALLLWVPAIALMARRLRAPFSPLLLTLAFDFFRRAGLDGMRGMVNVELAVAPGVGGLDGFRLSLFAAGVTATLMALRIEIARPRSSGVAPPSSAPVGAARAGGIALSLAALVAATDVTQTRFLHGAALVALLAAVTVALVEIGEAVAKASSASGPVDPRLAAALGLVALMWTAAHWDAAVAGDGSAWPRRAWIYEVHPDREAVVRVGSEGESRDAILARRLRLGLLGAVPNENTQSSSVAESAPSRSSVRVWVGAEGFYDEVDFVRQTSCSDESVLIEHAGYMVGGRVEIDYEASPGQEVRFGLRGGYGGRGTSEDMGSRREQELGFGQAWVGYRNDLLLAEIGAVLTNGGETDELRGVPAGRLRIGPDYVGGEFGFADSASPMGLMARVAVTGNLMRVSGIPLSYDFGLMSPPTYVDASTTEQFELIRPSLRLTVEPLPWLRVFARIAGANSGITAGGGLAFRILD